MKNSQVKKGLMVLTSETIGFKTSVTSSGGEGDLIVARRSNTTGVIVGVSGYPGDILWVIKHHLDGSEAIYSSDEFEPDEVASEFIKTNPSPS